METIRAAKAAVSTSILLILTCFEEVRQTKSPLVHRATEGVANLATTAIMTKRHYDEEDEAAYC